MQQSGGVEIEFFFIMHLHTPVLAGCSFCLSVLQESPRWSGWVIQHIVHPLIVLVVPLTCFLAVVSFIGHSWRRSSGDGVRSLAGSLLPFVIVMCVFIFQPSIFTEVVIANTLVSFVVALLLGLCLPFLAKWKDGSAGPVGAFSFAAIFSILVFSYVAIRDDHVFMVFYGFAIGLLSHITFIGGPFFKRKTPANESPSFS